MINVITINKILIQADQNFDSLSREIEEMKRRETTHEQDQYIAIVEQLLIYSQA